MNLSTNFTLEEMTFSQTAARRGIDNTPTPEHFRNLRRLCALLEDVRDVVGTPIRVTSGYRCPELNRAVGSRAKYSQHTFGCAADIKCVGVSVEETIEIIIEADLPFDQMIMEFAGSPSGGWVHISVPNDPQDKPRKEVLISDSKGERPYV